MTMTKKDAIIRLEQSYKQTNFGMEKANYDMALKFLTEPTGDSNVDAVINSFTNRAEVGFKKYNTNTDRDDLNVLDWLQHLQEELMDATIYLERLKKEVAKS